MGSLEIAPSCRALPPILRDEPSQSRRLFSWARRGGDIKFCDFLYFVYVKCKISGFFISKEVTM
nr:MAG TPA: hypothetical protein [Caudoviricetes sp.]